MLSIVLPVYRSAPRTQLALVQLIAVVRNEVSDAEIIVVNDGACSEVSKTVREVSLRYPGAMISLIEQEHGGRSKARNRGAFYATNKLLFFMDGDVLLQPGAITAHLQLHATYQQILVRGTILHLPSLVPFDDPLAGTLTSRAKASLRIVEGNHPPALLQRRVTMDAHGYPSPEVVKNARRSRFETDIHEWLGSRTADQPNRWIGCTGAHISIAKESFNTLGGFDEAMGMRWGAEDMEFGYRAEKIGIRILHAQQAVVCHMDHDASGREGDHDSALYYFSMKHHDSTPLRLKHYFAGDRSLAEVFA